MNKKIHTLLFTMTVLLSGWVSPVAATDKTPAGATSPAIALPVAQTGDSHAHADWAGLWVGVEGLFVEITLTTPGTYELEMMGESEDVKDNIRVPGRDAEGGIAFERNGETLLLRSATGEETGLKWLEDKKNCLMVEEFEGFCRD